MTVNTPGSATRVQRRVVVPSSLVEGKGVKGENPPHQQSQWSRNREVGPRERPWTRNTSTATGPASVPGSVSHFPTRRRDRSRHPTNTRETVTRSTRPRKRKGEMSETEARECWSPRRSTRNPSDVLRASWHTCIGTPVSGLRGTGRRRRSLKFILLKSGSRRSRRRGGSLLTQGSRRRSYVPRLTFTTRFRRTFTRGTFTTTTTRSKFYRN